MSEDSDHAKLSVGFLSLLSEDDLPSQASPKERMKKKLSGLASDFLGYETETIDSLQSEDNKFTPLMSYGGPIERKGAYGWKQYWGICTLSGNLILKTKQSQDKIYKQYRLKNCSIIKCKDKYFSLIRNKKAPVLLRTETIEQANIWIPTLSQYSSEMYTNIKLNERNIPMVIWNSRGIIISLNISVCQFLGFSEEELIGKNINTVIPPDRCNTNLYMNKATQQEENFDASTIVATLSTATIVPNKGDEIYVLFCFGTFTEYGKYRFILGFQPTSSPSNPIGSLRNLSGDISWLFYS